MFLSRNIEYLRKKNHLKQEDLAKMLNYKSYTTIQKWESGVADPPFKTLKALSDIFGVSMEKMANIDLERNMDEKTPHSKPSGAVLVPVYGKVAAGIPFEAVEDIIDYEEISEKLSQTGEFFPLQIQGDSMSPRICNKDIVIVRKQSDADSGDIVIALIDNQDACCKRLKKYYDGTIELISDNPSYKPLTFEKDKTDTVVLLGRVIELRAKF